VVFQLLPLTHLCQASGIWRDPAWQGIIRPRETVEVSVNLAELKWSTSQDALSSRWCAPSRTLRDVVSRGRYRLNCCVASPPDPISGQTCFHLDSSCVEFAIAGDLGNKIARIKEILGDSTASRAEVHPALYEARRWRAVEATPEICARLLQDPEEETRFMCAWVLTSMDDVASIPHLIEGLNDPSKKVREKCLVAIQHRAVEYAGEDFTSWKRWWMASGEHQSRLPWGKPAGNLQIKISSSKTHYRVREPVWLNVMFRIAENPQVLAPAVECSDQRANGEALYFTFTVKGQTGREFAVVNPTVCKERCQWTHFGVSFTHMHRCRILLNKWKMKTLDGVVDLTEWPGVYTVKAVFSPRSPDPKVWRGTAMSNPLTITVSAK